MSGLRRLCPSPFVCALALLLAGVVAAEEEGAPEALPDPLTLEHALSLAEAPNPVLAKSRAQVDRARAELEGEQARDGFRLSAEGRLRWIEPARETREDERRQDHMGGLRLRRQLYDFGRTRSAVAAAEAELEGSEWEHLSVRQRRRIEIMRRFFDVILADLEYARDNEAMAVAYVELDRVRGRHELGQRSDLELLERESRYEELRRQRAASQARQRTTRSRLALALNRPGMLPATLEMPELPALARKLPEVEELTAQALADNPGLRAQRQRVQAAMAAQQAARAERYPQLYSEAETGYYTRKTGDRDPWRAGVYIEVPLYTGGAVQAEIGKQRARFQEAQADLAVKELEIRQAILELWLELKTLAVEREGLGVIGSYRELFLDRARTLYELEAQADLGDSMARISEQHLEQARNELATALAWARLDALRGQGLGEPGVEVEPEADAVEREEAQ